MESRKDESETEVKSVGVNAGYAAFQLAKLLTTSEHHEDPATRARAREKIAKWEVVLGNIFGKQPSVLPLNYHGIATKA